MSGFDYVAGTLHAENVALPRLVERFGTPLYVYSAGIMRQRFAELSQALAATDPLICYAVKANPAVGVIRTFAELGSGADVVSGGELARALAAGVPPERIVFAGVGKSAEEIAQALGAGILQLNVESLEELAVIDTIASNMGLTASVALRLNPDVVASTHEKISTGRRHDKFGIGIDRLGEVFERLATCRHVACVGLHCHIGSQIAAVDDFSDAYARMVDTVRVFADAGFPIRRLNLGGGFGVTYQNEAQLDLQRFGQMVARHVSGTGVRVAFEPGRFLVAAAGCLLTRVIVVKTGSEGRRFLVLDAGMNNLLRPAMYGAVHPIRPVEEAQDAMSQPINVVGPICESSDVFARDYPLPPIVAGALVAIGEAGAYGATMASNYNSRPRPAEVLVDGERVTVLRPRRETASLLAEELAEAAVPAEVA